MVICFLSFDTYNPSSITKPYSLSSYGLTVLNISLSISCTNVSANIGYCIMADPLLIIYFVDILWEKFRIIFFVSFQVCLIRVGQSVLSFISLSLFVTSHLSIWLCIYWLYHMWKLVSFISDYFSDCINSLTFDNMLVIYNIKAFFILCYFFLFTSACMFISAVRKNP